MAVGSSSVSDAVRILRDRAATDTVWFAANCLKIVDKRRKLVPLEFNAVQRRRDKILEDQRAAGKPMRILDLKARQLGISTATQAKVIQRTTQGMWENHNALTVAHNKSTAGALYQMGYLMYQHLPDDKGLGLKPPVKNRRNKLSLELGNPQAVVEKSGELGINTSYAIDTAGEFEAGRGHTFSEVHGSEVAFWPNIELKLLGLLQAVPNEPETIVALESTPNGNNMFRDLWDDAVDGRNDYYPHFSAWWEDPSYSRPFANDDEKLAFIGQIGEGPYGEDEPMLVKEFGLTPEQLHWRRWKIDQPEIGGDLRKMRQEYPSTPHEAFISTGSHVFDQQRVQIIVQRTLATTDPRAPSEALPGPTLGILKEGKTKRQKSRHGLEIEVPMDPEWVPKDATGFGANHPYWRVWETPDPEGRYVVAVDTAEGEEVDRGESDYSAIQVINHHTRAQVAEYRSRVDVDLLTNQAWLAAHYWAHAWLIVEKTGAGNPVVNRLFHDYKYPLHLLYRREARDSSRDRTEQRIGWSTDRATKPMLLTTGTAVLREAVDSGDDERLDIIRSRLTADEFTSYLRDERGRTAARKGRFDDLLMAWLIGQQCAEEKQPLPLRKAGQVARSVLSSATRERWMV